MRVLWCFQTIAIVAFKSRGGTDLDIKLSIELNNSDNGLGLPNRGELMAPYPLLLVYSGPNSLSKAPDAKKRTNMYHDNFRFFLEQGLPCSHHSSTYSSEQGKVAVVTVAIVLTNETFMAYKTLLAAANAKCGGVD
jgi:hypothetical protein